MVVFFFFKQKTTYEMRISDWSSDVCSSDLSVSKEARQSCSIELRGYSLRGRFPKKARRRSKEYLRDMAKGHRRSSHFPPLEMDLSVDESVEQRLKEVDRKSVV